MELSDIQRRVLSALRDDDRIVSGPGAKNGEGRRHRLQLTGLTVPLQTLRALSAAGYIVAFDNTITPAGRRALGAPQP